MTLSRLCAPLLVGLGSIAVAGAPAPMGSGQAPVAAPVPEGSAGGPSGAESSLRSRQRPGNDAFVKQSPQIGEMIPDVAAYDADGHPVRLRDLTGHGHYSVLVFGCLT